MVDDFDGDAAGGGFGEGARDVAVETRPGLLVDLGPQCRFQRLVGVGGGAEEIGVADEEAFLVVIGGDKPQRDRLRAAGLDLADLRLEYIDAFDLYPDLVAAALRFAKLLDLDVGLTKHDEEVAGP